MPFIPVVGRTRCHAIPSVSRVAGSVALLALCSSLSGVPRPSVERGGLPCRGHVTSAIALSRNRLPARPGSYQTPPPAGDVVAPTGPLGPSDGPRCANKAPAPPAERSSRPIPQKSCSTPARVSRRRRRRIRTSRAWFLSSRHTAPFLTPPAKLAISQCTASCSGEILALGCPLPYHAARTRRAVRWQSAGGPRERERSPSTRSHCYPLPPSPSRVALPSPGRHGHPSARPS